MSDVCLLDTNVASALWDELHGKHAAYRERHRQLADAGAHVYVSVITLAEVDYGLRVAPNVDADRQARVRTSMTAFEVVDVDHHVAEAYAEIRSRLFRKFSPRDRRGRLTAKVVPDLWERTPDKLLGIQENDLWQASLAIARDYLLITTDRMSHIASVADSGLQLRVDNWDRPRILGVCPL